MSKVILEVQEIESLKKIQEEIASITQQLGEIEIQSLNLQQIKSQIIDNLSKIKASQQELGATLSSKYGQGTIDLTSGEFTKSN